MYSSRLAWALGTCIGAAISLIAVPIFAQRSAVDLDRLSQKAQRLRLPFCMLCFKYCLQSWFPHSLQNSHLPHEYWRWKVPDCVDIPLELCCPITWQLLAQPVILHGDVFECAALVTWLRQTPRHPLRADVSACLDEVRLASECSELCCAFAEWHGAHAVDYDDRCSD